ncbi:UNVERIFIED_ORG: hypothetical protein QOE_2927 [Clostridioides difficile F501]
MDKKCFHSVVFDPEFRKPGTAFFIMPGERLVLQSILRKDY